MKKITNALTLGVILFYAVPFLSVQTAVNKIAFHSNRSGSNEIYLMNTDGSKVKQLTRNSVDDLCPVISPDGSRIAFLSNRDGEMKIYIMKNGK